MTPAVRNRFHLFTLYNMNSTAPTPTQEQITSAIKIYGAENVSLAITMVDASDPDCAYIMLQDNGNEDAAEAVEFLFFQ